MIAILSISGFIVTLITLIHAALLASIFPNMEFSKSNTIKIVCAYIVMIILSFWLPNTLFTSRFAGVGDIIVEVNERLHAVSGILPLICATVIGNAFAGIVYTLYVYAATKKSGRIELKINAEKYQSKVDQGQLKWLVVGALGSVEVNQDYYDQGQVSLEKNLEIHRFGPCKVKVILNGHIFEAEVTSMVNSINKNTGTEKFFFYYKNPAMEDLSSAREESSNE